MSDGPRVAVVADIHGNLAALRAVLDDIAKHGPFDRRVVAGDYCLNGPDPAAALDLALAWATDTLMGNTDRDIVNLGVDDPDLGEKKRASIEWCREQLGAARIDCLSRLKFGVEIKAPDGSVMQVVHANPRDLDRHIFPDMPEDELATLLAGCRAQLLTVGHLHIPFTRRFGAMSIVNVAACGLPRDGDRRAVWGEFAWSPATGWSTYTHRVVYDYGETVLRILDARMPHPERRIRDLLRARYD